MNLNQRILFHSTALFMKYGVRSVSMDDIAGDLGISKKTIYQYFENKEAIILAGAKQYLAHEEAEATMLVAQSNDAVHELVLFMRRIHQTFRDMSPRLVSEVQKYYPTVWKRFEAHEKDFILPMVEANLNKGKLEGYYRSDLNVKILSRMRVAQVDMGFRQEVFPARDFHIVDVQLEMFRLYMYGIVTEKGKKLLTEYLKSTPTQTYPHPLQNPK